jgi:predicted negative regulator of RcsB-dependent stress response
MKDNKSKTNNKVILAVIIIAVVAISTFVWHDYRVSKREKAAVVESIQEVR